MAFNRSMGARLIAAALAIFGSPTVGAAESVWLPFGTDPLSAAGLSPEGCILDTGPARGSLGPVPRYELDQGECHSGLLGSDVDAFAGDETLHAEALAQFESAPFEAGLSLAGPAALVIHYVDAAASGSTALDYVLDEVRADGSVTPIASGRAIEGLEDDSRAGYTGRSQSFTTAPSRLAPGSRLRLRLLGTEPGSAGGRLLYGGVPFPESVSGVPGLVRERLDFSDAGLRLEIGDAGGKQTLSGPVAGAFESVLLPLVAAAALRRRRHPLVRANSFM